MARKKDPPEDTSGTGEDQGTVGQARHDIAGAYDTVSNDIGKAGNWLAGLDRGWDVFGIDKKPTPPAATPSESADTKEIRESWRDEQL